jgi:hypothetical protein
MSFEFSGACFRGKKSDELTSYRNKAKQTHGSIRADISRDRRRCYEIREAGKNIHLDKLQL